ncbi:hypothetical protein [Nostoc sp.]|uniref:hypothetical protein n=1 Tax=Nostoc sp. TaxID=1180 RepID=UPI002FFB6971
MSNYLFHLVAKGFNLIDTVQPLVLSVFEPLPESNLDWEPSITTDSTELETTSEAEKFPNFDIVQLLEKRSPATIGQISEEITNPLLTNLTSTPVQSSQPILKSIPNLTQKPDLELSSNWPFLDSVLTQVSTDNQQFTSNPEQKKSITPLTFAAAQLSQKQSSKINPVVSSIQPSNSDQKTSTTTLNLVPGQLSQKQLTKINPAVSFVQPSNIVNWERLITQPFVESEILSPTANKAAFNLNTESIVIPQKKTYLSNHLVSVHNTESNTSLSKHISEQRQIPLKSFSHPLITINRLGLSFQSRLKSDLQTYFTESPTNSITFSFIPPDQKNSLPNLNPIILKTAIAKEKNTLVSKLFEQESGELTTQSLNNQSIKINQSASHNSLPKVLYLRQFTPETQAETSTILSIPSVLKQGKSATENLHKQPIKNNPVFIHSQLPQVESSENFPLQLQSESTAISTTGNSWRGYTKSYAPTISQVLPLTSMQAVETSTPASNSVIQPQEQVVRELPQKRWLRQRQGRTLQTGNIFSSEILSSQIIEQPTAIPLVSFANSPVITQVLPLTPVQGVETSTPNSTVIQPQEQLLSKLSKSARINQTILQNVNTPETLINEKGQMTNDSLSQLALFASLYLPQKRSLQTENISISEILSSQITEQPTAIPLVSFANAPASNSDIILTFALHPSIAQNNIQSQVNFSDSHLSDFRGEKASVQEVGSQNYNTSDRKHIGIQKIGVVEQWDELGQVGAEMNVNYVHHPANMQRQKINPNEGVLPSPVENLILPQNASPNLSMSADRFKKRQHIDVQKIGVVEQWDELGLAGGEMNVNYAYHPANMQRQQINRNQGILTSPVENLILPQNPSPNLSMSANRSEERQHIGIQKIGVVEQWDELGLAGGEMNVNYVHHPASMQRQKINRNQGILTSPVENLILPQNPSPNLSMSADRGKDGVGSLYFRQLEESDFRPLSQPINDLTVENLSVIAASSKKAQKRSSKDLDTPPKIQVTIGRLEIRNAAPAPPPPRPKPRTATSVMSLNEYLQRRARRR